MHNDAQDRTEEALLVEKLVPNPGYCLFSFKAPYLASRAEPGQFVMVYMLPEYKHMLPRPFSVHLVDRKHDIIKLLFEIKGSGTGLMAGAAVGSTWKISGPLGRGFPALSNHALLVAGGIGIAPLAFLAASANKPCTLLYGARSANQVACPPENLMRPDLNLLEVTEDGSRGRKGMVTDYLPELLPAAPVLFACGPGPMLRSIQKLCLQEKVQAWLSLEERMACGIGACVGCAVQTRDGYQRVCSDGPVFAAEEVLLDEQG